MARKSFYKMLSENPIIAALKNSGDLEEALESPVGGIFLLGGNICEIGDMVKKARESEKKLFIHMDLMEGMGKDYYALKYLKNTINPDGVITTKANLVKYAKEFDLFVVQRIFMLDSMSFDTGIKSVKTLKPDAIEIMPGIVPGIIKQMSERIDIPIIAGGLIRSKQEAIECLKAGAMGVSTSRNPLWYM